MTLQSEGRARMSSPDRHGGSLPVPVEALLSDDAELALAWADMEAWEKAHPCTCPEDAGLHEEGCPQC